MSQPTEHSDQDAPLLRVVRGRPSEEELAAVLVVLRARATTAETPTPAPAAGWNAYGRGVRRPLVPGPGAWQAAAPW